MIWLWLVFVLLASLYTLKWFADHGSFHWSHSGGFQSFSSGSEHPPKPVPVSKLPYLIEKLLERKTIEWLGFSRPGIDEPNVSFMWMDERELRMDTSFKTASNDEYVQPIRGLMAQYKSFADEDHVWNEGMGPELESRTLGFRVIPRQELLVRMANDLVENYLKVEGDEVDVWVGHGSDVPTKNGLAWRRHRDRLAEVLDESAG